MAKRKIVWSLRAKLDLIDILEFYYQRNKTKTYSKKLNKNIRDSIKLLNSFPYIGLKTDIKNTRVLIEGNHGIFYEIKSEIIKIITI